MPSDLKKTRSSGIIFRPKLENSGVKRVYFIRAKSPSDGRKYQKGQLNSRKHYSLRKHFFPDNFSEYFFFCCWKRVFKELKILSDVDSLLNFRQLKGTSVFIDDDEFETTLSKAVGNVAKGSGLKDRLERVSQLTGFSDPIYAEACVSVHQFDIVLDILIINQTKNTLQVTCF